MAPTDKDPDPWRWAEYTPQPERDARARAVYDAEDLLAMAVDNWGDEIRQVDVPSFARDVLDRSGWARTTPLFVFDLVLVDGKGRAGHFEAGTIHLVAEDSGRLGRLLVLHELAHAIAPDAAHGPLYCRVYVDLVSEGLGPTVAADLLEVLETSGVPVADSIDSKQQGL